MSFIAAEVPDVIKNNMIRANVWNVDYEVDICKLKLITVKHYDFSYNIHAGQMIVASIVADDVLIIFKELFKIKFPISKIKLMEEYNGDDELSMQDNNSSCFNYRKIIGSDKLSKHSYGLAIDLNPLQNPYIKSLDTGFLSIAPAEAVKYMNRKNIRPGMVEPVVNIFKKNKFSVWGGDWNDILDYHHFQVSEEIVNQFLE